MVQHRCRREITGIMRYIWGLFLLMTVFSFLRCGEAAGASVCGQIHLEGLCQNSLRQENPCLRNLRLRSICLIRSEEGGSASEDDSFDSLSGILERLNLQEAEDYALASQSGSALSLTDIVRKLVTGDLDGIGRDMLAVVRQTLLAEISAGGSLIGQILLLGILGAVFANFSSVFSASQISETGFYVVYLLLFTMLTAAVGESMAVAAETVGTILGFMKVLMPAYFLAVAFSGGTVSSAAMYEAAMFGMTAGAWAPNSVMIPLVRVWLVLALAGNLTKENVFSRLTELVGQIIGWGMKTLLGLVLGLQMAQTLVLPYVDSLKNGALRKMVGLIPGVGQSAAAAAQMLMGAGVLVKNSVGMAAVIVLAVMAAVPVVKLLVLMAFYQCTAAILEPVCDKRVLACVTAAAKCHKELLRIVFTAVLIFVVTIAIACAGTNAAYLA